MGKRNMRDPAKDAECLQRYEDLLPRMADYVDKWVEERPDDLALIEYNTGAEVTWKDFALRTKEYASKLLSLGLVKGDIIATMLPLFKEHIFLIYACYRLGVIISPLDIRFKAVELRQCFEKMSPKAFIFLGKTPVTDLRPIVQEIMGEFPSCTQWIQFQPEPELVIDGATRFLDFFSDVGDIYTQMLDSGDLEASIKLVNKRDPCLIIFTTGSTGAPKPALICHENILIQDIGLKMAFERGPNPVQMVNLPPSHVGCVTEMLAWPIYSGVPVVFFHVFTPESTLDAIQKYHVTFIGQIPALFAMEWRLPNYADYDLSSLLIAVYGGQAVTRQFLIQLSQMAPEIATGLGLTETAGFVTYTPVNISVDEIAASVGYDMPLCPISIRDVMKEDGSSGDEKTPGEIGEICFSGPQVFLGYLNDPENTAKTISTDGFCYTGDLGSYDENGLHFAGRSKLVIKPKGYQVYPPEVEDFLVNALRDKVSNIALVGAPHDVFTEGIVAFVEPKPDQEVTEDDVNEAAQDLAAYKRPSAVVVLEPGGMPLNRINKIDYVELKKRALAITEELRAQGKWDAN
ncbi:MAG TPA: class I adenylate-forming enzyme family protein [Candidatus Lokiarchaeia archaeon]|nr:class I adenylate-forming enzyme family protein [Candidatus Lokiarchaeia archaeon]